MHAGKIVHWEHLHLKVALSGAASASSGFGAAIGANLQSWWAPNLVDLVPGIILGCSTQTADAPGGAKHAFALQIPSLLISLSEEYSGFEPDIDTEAFFDDFRLYALNGGVWLVKWSAIRWFINGALHTTLGGGEMMSGYFSPAGIPLMGIPPVLSAGASITPDPAIGVVADANFEHSASVTGTGGWRFDDGGWQTLPVNPASLPEIPATPAPCTCDDADVGSAGAGDTFSGSVSGYARYYGERGSATRYECDCTNGPASPKYQYDVRDAINVWEQWTGQVMLLPDLTKGVRRFNDDDYRAMIVRGGFPRTLASARAECWEEPTPTDPPSTTITEEIHPSHSTMLSVVGNDPHIIEEPLDLSSYAPVGISGSRWVATKTFSEMVSAGACPPEEPDDGGGDPPPPAGPVPCWPLSDGFCGSSRGAGFGDIQSNEHIIGYFDHEHPWARYINTVCNPGWSYLYYFPEDLWEVYGDEAKSDDYWLPIRTQWLEHPALPSEERRETRNSLVSCPLFEGGFGPFIKDSIIGGAETSWWGITRFKVQTFAPDASKALPQSLSGWSLTDCTGSALSDGLELTPEDGKTKIVAEYAIGAFDRAPYLYPHLADRVEVDWFVGNIDSIRVELVSAYGDRIELEDAPGIEPKPLDGTDRRYAGSWAQDHGNLVVDDTGVDVAKGGGSLAAMQDPERVHFLEMLGGLGARRLRFTIEVLDPEEPVKIKWPKFHRSDSDAHLVYENGHHTSLLWPDGPGIRWGQWAWLQHDPTQLLAVPNVYPLGYPPGGWKASVLDWLCWRRVVLEGVERSTDLRAEIQAIYDNYELIGIDVEPSNNNQVYRECDGLTISWLLPYGKAGTGVLVNTLAEVPPLAVFPGRARDEAAGYEYDAGYDQVAYSLAQEPRRYVHPREPLHVFDPSGPTQWTSELSPQPVDGWKVTQHSHAVTNDEGPTFLLDVGGKVYAHASPWHGYFAICLQGEEAPAGGVWVLHDADDNYMRSNIEAGDVWFRRAKGSAPVLPWDHVVRVTDFGDVEFAAFDYDPSTLRLEMLIARPSDEIWRCHSDDDGTTWTEPTLFMSNALQATLARGSSDGSRVIVWRDAIDGYAYGMFRESGDTAWSAPFQLLSESSSPIEVEEGGMCNASQAQDSPGTWCWSPIVAGEESPSDWISHDDCRTWRRIT